MGKNDISLTWRLSERFQNMLDELAATMDDVSRGDIVCLLLRAYCLSPTIVTRIEARELREPLSSQISLSIPTDLYEWLQSFSSEIGEPVSYVIRMAIYVEMKKRGVLEREAGTE